MSLNSGKFHFGLGRMSSFTYYASTRLIEKKPRQLPPGSNLLKSFDLYTWISLGISLISIAVTLYTILFIESKVSLLLILVKGHLGKC